MTSSVRISLAFATLALLAQPAAAQAIKRDSLGFDPAGGHHFDGAKAEETIVQIIGMGPVKTVNINPDGTSKQP